MTALEAIRFDGEDTWRPWVEYRTLVRVRPRPTVRPYTPVEAAGHLGREFRVGDGTMGSVASVASENILGSMAGLAAYRSYVWLAENCYWTDDGSPCGVVEEPA